MVCLSDIYVMKATLLSILDYSLPAICISGTLKFPNIQVRHVKKFPENMTVFLHFGYILLRETSREVKQDGIPLRKDFHSWHGVIDR